ncbi:MAG: molybdopterin-dependent oxidoreductase [Anaerolineales bacterium]|nr:MAG: molybdopterin-dependent oxidoreductase [Anaerolineales bacterium]
MIIGSPTERIKEERMVEITINGKKVSAPKGTTVLRAAEMAGIQIPKLCDHKHLAPYGGCRLCIVEVKGMRVPIASCTLPVSDGMEIETETEALKQSRKFILSMLFSDRNHFCPFCQVSGGDCELQNAAYHEEMTHWPIQPGWNHFITDTSHPYFILDNNRCILCRRCVRACAEMAGNFTLSVAERGASSMIVADTNVPLGDSTCIKCGSCVQVCPTGALIDRTSAYQAKDEQLTEIKSVCAGCSVGCSVNIMVRDNRIVRIEGDWDGDVNHGVLCEHGRYDPVTETRTRLTTPLMRVNGTLQPVSWEEALSAVQEKLQPLAGNKHGVAALASTRLPAETLSAFKDLFQNKFDSELVTSIEEGVPTAAVSKYAEKHAGFEGKIDTLRNSDTVLCIGANVNRSHMVAGFLFKRNLSKGIHLINIDPGESSLDEIAHMALKPNNGADLVLIRGLQAVIAKEGLERKSLNITDVDARIQKAVKETGIPLDKLTQAAQILAHAVSPVIIYGKGITAQRDETLIEELHQLAVQVGCVDEERNGLLSLKGEANSLAAALLGLDESFELNGHKAVYVALGDDHVSRSLAERVSKAPYLVVQASYESGITEKADVVLPVSTWSEQEGHYINLDGRIKKAEKLLSPPEHVRDNLDVLTDLAKRMSLTLDTDWQNAVRARKASVTLN